VLKTVQPQISQILADFVVRNSGIVSDERGVCPAFYLRKSVKSAVNEFSSLCVNSLILTP